MSLGLLLPGALVSLVALLLPLLIHLARRNQQQPLDFAALRWLNRKPKPRRRLRVDDIPLLLLDVYKRQGSLGAVGWDDEGVKCKQWDLIKAGKLVDYQTCLLYTSRCV